MGAGETVRLADHVSRLDISHVPDEVVAVARLCVLDTIGVALVAGDQPWSIGVARLADDAPAGNAPCGVWGTHVAAPPAVAALANGTAAHGVEMDDRAPRASAHPGCSVVPAAMAAVEAAGGDGADLVAAVVAGYEVVMRIGFAMRMRPGVHKSGHKGVWGAVAAAARGRRLDPKVTQNAFGLAGSMAGGLFEFSQGKGTMVKRLHGGLAAHNGVLAADLAERGLTGPATVLEGVHGYCRTFGDDGGAPDLDQLTTGLGSTFRILERELKPYAAWGGSHLAIDAVGALLERWGFVAQDVVGIEIGGSRRLVQWHDEADPASLMAAQYSLPMVTAVALVRGPAALVDPTMAWTPDVLTDPDVRRLVTATRVVVDDDLQEASIQRRHYGGARVTVTLRDGRRLDEMVQHSRGTLENPMSTDEVVDKFYRLAVPRLPASRCEEIVDLVHRLEACADVRQLTRLLALEPPSSPPTDKRLDSVGS